MSEVKVDKKPFNIEELKRIKQAKKQAKQVTCASSPQEPPLVVMERTFVEMPNQHTLEKSHGEIRVMTFNVLAQGLIKRELFPHSGNILKWKSRRKMIVDEIKLYHPDILTLQELDNFDQYYKDILTHLGYKTKYTKFETKAHGCGIAYKHNKFTFVDFKDIDYDTDTTCPPSTLTGNIAQLLALQWTEQPDTYFVIGNTHLYWKPAAHYERLRQAIIFSNRLLEFKSNLARYHRDCQWIPFLLGDLNTSPHEPAYPMLTKSEPSRVDILKKEHPIDALLKAATPFQWHSIYSQHPNNNNDCGEPKFTNYTVAHKGPLDYMFIDKTTDIVIKRILTIPKEEFLQPSLPNQHFGSDHLCLAADIEF